MTYKDIRLYTEGGVSLAVCNTFPKPYRLEDAVEDAASPDELEAALNTTVESYTKKITIDRITPTYIRYRVVCNMCNNIELLYVYL